MFVTLPLTLTVGARPLNPAERLAAILEDLCKAVAAHGVRGLLTASLILLLWGRLRRMASRTRVLASRIDAGAPLFVPRRRAARSAAPRPYIRLSRGFGWLVRVVPGTVFGASQLQFLLADPAMAELAATPPMRRLLRPLCRMLGVSPPPVATPAQDPAAPPVAEAASGLAADPPPPEPRRLTPTPPTPPAPSVPKLAT